MFNDPELSAAIAYGARRASRSALSAQAMEEYIEQRYPTLAADAVTALADMGLVDDATLARERAAAKQGQQWGHYRIRVDLQRRGIPDEHIAAALRELSDDDDVCHAAAERLARRHTSLSRDVAFRRIVSGLARLGFSPQLSYRAASDALNDSD